MTMGSKSPDLHACVNTANLESVWWPVDGVSSISEVLEDSSQPSFTIFTSSANLSEKEGHGRSSRS